MAIDSKMLLMSNQNHSSTHIEINAVQDPDQHGCTIPRSALLRVLKGVAVATKSPSEDIDPVVRCISSSFEVQEGKNSSGMNGDRKVTGVRRVSDSFTMQEWYGHLLPNLQRERSQQIAKLALGVAYLRQHSRTNQLVPVAANTMENIWQMIYSVLTCPSLDPPLCSATRSSQDFLSIALCSLIEDGNIAELFRLHVWLPDGKRGKQDLKIHSHQPFAQSWILAGEGRDVSYDVQLVQDSLIATHAQYLPSWSDGKSLSSTYKTHQTVSVIANTGILVRAKATESAVHKRDMTYSVPAAAFHTSCVLPDRFHATFFFFDAQRGFVKDASVLGPVNGGPVVAHRDPAGITVAALADIVQSERSKEMLR